MLSHSKTATDTPAADVSGIKIGAGTAGALADGATDLTFTWQLYNNGAGLLTQVGAPSSTSSATRTGQEADLW